MLTCRSLILFLVFQVLLPTAAGAQVLLTQQEALRMAFPEPAAIERYTAFLAEDEVARADGLAGPDVEVDQRVITYYVGKNGKEPLGVAYFDAHRVRTLPEVLMIVVTLDARIERIEILKFQEPPDYLVPESWLGQFSGRELDGELSVKGSIVNMTGATLTSRAITNATRRILALHQVINPLPASGEK
jgi:Na+-translocating ferredoxin:NAD+ oxidoreductase RnfG subunit